MIRKDILKCSAVKEFSHDERNHFFSVTGKKVIHNIDTLYYAVVLEEEGQRDSEHGIIPLIDDLQKLRDQKNDSDTEKKTFMGLEYKACSFAHYRHCLSLDKEFDIFIAEYLPNANTPRVVVQIRSVALWADGDKACVKKSYDYLFRILYKYALHVKSVRENRIDYAYHTNAIQNADSFLTDSLLLKCLKSNLTKYSKVGNIGKEITVEYLSLGMRKSNNVFFRAYNKSREVVEMGYKSIFIGVWKDNGLISAYDEYVLKKAYEFGSKTGFDSAVAIGKIDWYMTYGKNESIKLYLQDLREKYLVDGSNNGYLTAELKKILPDITSVMNFEYQTKRKYYRCQQNSIDRLAVVEADLTGYPKLRHLFRILDNRALFLDKLTSATVCFVKDRNKPAAEIDNSDYLDFWRRIRSCKTSCACDGDLYREYARGVDKARAAKGIADKVAVLSVLDDFDGEADFTGDLADALSYFNDNDVSTILAVDGNGEVQDCFDFEHYDILKGRKKRQYRFLAKEETTPTALPTDTDKPFPNG